MGNEAKTENLVRNILRKHGYYNDPDIIVEEKKSDNPSIDKLLKNASKQGIGAGYPQFIIRNKQLSGCVVGVIDGKANAQNISKKCSHFADCAVAVYCFTAPIWLGI